MVFTLRTHSQYVQLNVFTVLFGLLHALSWILLNSDLHEIEFIVIRP